jgi:hypothetical protein
MKGLRKTIKILNHDSQCLSQDSNQVSTEYKFRALPLDQHVQNHPHQFQLNAAPAEKDGSLITSFSLYTILF